jgi:hypothetical protein
MKISQRMSLATAGIDHVENSESTVYMWQRESVSVI